METRLKKIIMTGDDARSALLRGIDAVADVVEPTLGPGGMNVVIGQTFYKAMITNDGIRVAKQALNDESLNEIERLGAQLVVDSVSEEDEEAGDGTTTTTTLTRALAHRVLSIRKDGELPMNLKKKITKECGYVVDKIKESAQHDFSIMDIANVSMEDETHSKNVEYIFTKYGKDVDVNLRFNKESSEVIVEEESGYSFVGGFASPLFAIDKSKMESNIKNPRLFLFNSVISHDELEEGDMSFFDIISNILEAYPSDPIVIIANDYDDKIIKRILAVKAISNVNLTLLKRIQYKHAEISEEIQLVSGCKESFFDNNFDATTGSNVVESMIITKDKVTIINNITKHDVEKFIDGNSNKQQVNRLSRSIVILRVGGKTYSEMNYLRHKYEDAVNAVRGAMEEGAVEGGGLCLAKIDDELPEDYILKGILSKPAKIIALNMGVSYQHTVDKSIIDSAKTTRSAVEHACSIASLLVTTNTVIATKDGQIEEVDPSAMDTSELPLG